MFLFIVSYFIIIDILFLLLLLLLLFYYYLFITSSKLSLVPNVERLSDRAGITECSEGFFLRYLPCIYTVFILYLSLSPIPLPPPPLQRRGRGGGVGGVAVGFFSNSIDKELRLMIDWLGLLSDWISCSDWLRDWMNYEWLGLLRDRVFQRLKHK
uniref:hypothetical protein n=1 Tax=Cyathus jiayuguanensis TaxID=380660 RepID=UPI0023F0AC6E|nr:hypothetical protein P4C85_mgp07 [Cyathus jiayuguanensis]WDS46500.1 hypothetical protein [Cyathus jiayuguanensis]